MERLFQTCCFEALEVPLSCSNQNAFSMAETVVNKENGHEVFCGTSGPNDGVSTPVTRLRLVSSKAFSVPNMGESTRNTSC